jgi:pimeloyl-ACP methyl ester carboxylesterase
VLLFAALSVVIVLVSAAVFERHATADAWRRFPPQGKMVDVGGHRLHAVCTGRGTPTVVLEAGLWGSSADWSLVQPEVARLTRVCSYDRAGMGYSDPGPQPRGVGDVVKDLHALLRGLGARGPYVLVGHSLGGLYVRLHAAAHPHETAGLVLVDSGHEDQFDRIPEIRDLFRRQADSLRSDARLAPFGLLRARQAWHEGSLALYRLSSLDESPAVRFGIRLRPPALREAHREMTSNDALGHELRRTRASLDVPLVVLTHGSDPLPGVPPLRMAAIESTWRELQRDLLTLSPQGVQRIAETSGHYIQNQQPELVVGAIRGVVEKAARR